MKGKTAFYALAIVVLLLASLGWRDAAANPGILYVKVEGVTSGLCDSWENACELQYALGLAVSNDQIWVAQGTYHPGASGERDATFQLVSRAAVYGGFAGNENSLGERDWLTNQVILSGDLNDNGLDGNDSYHVVTGADYALLDGVTISGGNADEGPDDEGGGMYNSYASPSLVNVTFTGNNASSGGGGMYNNYANANLTNVTFSGNTANNGGGMANENSNPWLTDVTFINNSAVIGGGMENFFSQGNFWKVTFSENTAEVQGGGMYNHTCNLWMKYIIFSGNTAQTGGGMYNNNNNTNLANASFYDNTGHSEGGGIYNEDSYVLLDNATFSGNTAFHGGAICNVQGSSPSLTNVTLSANTALQGGGVYNAVNSNPDLINVTILDNKAIEGDGIFNSESTPTLLNSIVWGTDAQIYGTANVSYSDIAVEDGQPPYPGTGNINADPLLSPLAYNGGFTLTHALRSSSPAINTGTNDGCPANDQRGVSRPRFGICDMGAYEYAPIVYIPLAMK